MGSPVLRKAAGILAWGILLAAGGCRDVAPEVRSPETLAVEEKAGSFLDYYEAVLLASRRYSASPDSFRAFVDSLPGSHLTDEEWEAWTAPYERDAGPLAERLEEVIGELSRPLEGG
jgi:hypothetical protein